MEEGTPCPVLGRRTGLRAGRGHLGSNPSSTTTSCTTRRWESKCGGGDRRLSGCRPRLCHCWLSDLGSSPDILFPQRDAGRIK